ncbi:hypothetical protein CRUP_015926 [Coryphaenoides rupestris]|nr:hypothetical protein CRUP_015926 [Coryphaenoides rupestris]
MSDLSLWCEEVVEVEDQCEDMSQEEEIQSQQTTATAGPSQVRAAWDPAASGHRVIQRLLHVERRYAPSALYIALAQRDPERREELVKWALEVCYECGCDEAVFPLGVSLMDRFLSSSLALPASPYCLAAACLLVASKLGECDTEMERVVLATLRWDTASVTPQDFLPLLLAPVGGMDRTAADGGEREADRELLATMRRHADTLVAMCVCDSRFLGAPPSLVAAAAVNSALRGLSGRSPPRLAALGELLAGLCQTDTTVLGCYSEMIELALRQRLRAGLQAEEASTAKDEEVDDEEEEDERAGTPTDMREVDF